MTTLGHHARHVRLSISPTSVRSSSAKRGAHTRHSIAALHETYRDLCLPSTEKCCEYLTSQITLDGGPRRTNKNSSSKSEETNNLRVNFTVPTSWHAQGCFVPTFLSHLQAAYCPWQPMDDHWQVSGCQWTSSSRQVQISI